MHGNVSEWVLDRYEPDFYAKFGTTEPAIFPVCIPNGDEYPRVARGGSWQDFPYDPEDPGAPLLHRSAARIFSSEDWKIQDPQLPQSKWYLTDAQFLGFRVVRPLTPPTQDQIKQFVLAPDVPKGLENRP
jgi:formylglycine-generating enzyme required for sulfatase activity